MQQSLITAIKNNDREGLLELLNTAAAVEKMNAALFAAYSNKIVMFEPLITSGIDINQADKGGLTCLHWAVYRNNLSMMKLLLQHGAEHKANKNGDTPAGYAEDRDYVDAFNLLVQHFLVAPIKSRDHDELVDDDIVLQEIEMVAVEAKQKISAKTLNLLIEFQIKKRDMDLLGIELKDIEYAADPSFLGKCLHFLVTISITRTLMLWSFMSRSSIKLDKNTTPKIKQIFPAKPREYRHIISTASENDDAQHLLSTPEIIGTDEQSKESQSFLEYDDVFMSDNDDRNKIGDDLTLSVYKNNKNNGTTGVTKQKRCVMPVLTSSALLFESKNVLRGVVAISVFHDTTEAIISGVWNAFLSSLIINGLVNYYRYPEERGLTDLLDAFGVTGLRNIVCIQSIEFIKKSFFCSENYIKSYNDILSSSLSSYYIWPFVAGVPVVFGVINATHVSWNMKALDKGEVKALILQLKKYKSGFWADGLGWLFTAIIPDLFPPAAMLFMLPQPAIKQALEKIKQTIIWDGRLSANNRETLFTHLHRFTLQRSQFTQMKAMSILAEIADSIHFKNLSILKEEGVDDEILKTLITIKTKALNELGFLAKHYNLPRVPKSLFRPLFRFLYANYIMWGLGYPQQWFLQPLFFAIKAIKWYYTLIFYKTIIGGIVSILNRKFEENKCYAEGKIWSWVDLWQNYTCSICGDLPIFINDIWIEEDCFGAYLGFPRPWNELMENIVSRENKTNAGGMHLKFNFSAITTLDLSAQYKIFNQKSPQLNNLLAPLSAKLSGLTSIIVKAQTTWLHDNISYADFEALMKFAQHFRMQLDTLTITKTLTSDFDDLLSETIVNSTIKRLTLCLSPYIRGYFEKFSNALAQSSVVFLDLCATPEHGTIFSGDSVVMLATHLPKTLINLAPLNIFINNPAAPECYQLAQKLYDITVFEDLTISAGDKGSLACYLAFANVGKHKNPNISIYFELNWQPLYNITLLTHLLSNGSFPMLKGLRIKFDNSFVSFSEEILLTLFEAIPYASLEWFGLNVSNTNFLNNTNQSRIAYQLVNAIEKSNISVLESALFWGDEASKILSTSFSKLSRIWFLGVSFHPTTCEGPKAILRNLPEAPQLTRFNMWFAAKSDCTEMPYENIITSNITILQLRDINDTREALLDNALNQFLKKLYQSKIGYLMLDFYFDVNTTISLTEGLAGSSVERLELSANLTDQNVDILAAGLIVRKAKHGLWIDEIKRKNRWFDIGSNTNLSILVINTTDTNIDALCRNLPYTYIARNDFSNTGKLKQHTDTSENCGVISSANSPHPAWPYLLVARTYLALRRSLTAVLFAPFNSLNGDKINSEKRSLRYANENSHAIAASNLPTPIKHVPTTGSILDASDYVADHAIIVDLSSYQLQENRVGSQSISISEDTIAVRGSRVGHNMLIGGDHSLLDVSQSLRTNFLQTGKNNQLRLGFFSKDHIVVKENQGTVQIDGFDSKDTLHIVSEQTVYGETNAAICHNEMLEKTSWSSHGYSFSAHGDVSVSDQGDVVSAVIDLKGTTVQLFNTRCEEIENNININDPEAVEAALTEVMDASDDTSSILYNSLLGICDTFLQSVHQSAWLTAIPVFAGEILYHSGGYTRAEIEKFAEEIQTLLLVSIANSPHAMAASLLARCLATRLTHSPKVISTLATGAGIITSVMRSVLTTNASFGWIALQSGVALMGSVAGSLGIQKLPELGRWGLNQASRATDYLGRRMGFWQQPPTTDADHCKNLSGQVVIANSGVRNF